MPTPATICVNMIYDMRDVAREGFNEDTSYI